MRILPAVTLALVAAGFSAAQAEEPILLDNPQMDRVVAGQLDGGFGFETPDFDLNIPEGFAETLGGAASSVLSVLSLGENGNGPSVPGPSVPSVSGSSTP